MNLIESLQNNWNGQFIRSLKVDGLESTSKKAEYKVVC